MRNAAVNTDSLSSISELPATSEEKVFTARSTSVSKKKDSTSTTKSTHGHFHIRDVKELEKIYSFGNEIGGGSFGKVLEVKEIRNSKRWALKIVSKSIPGTKMIFLKREVHILKQLNHPHIIHLEKVFESHDKIFLVLELCNGELHTVYKKKKPFSEQITRKIIHDLVGAIAYLHRKDIVHRDLKMENILLANNPDDPTDEYYIKVTDFGLSVIKSSHGMDNMLHECCGTALYMAPEMLSGSYSHQCDVWAIGIIMFMLIFGTYPFQFSDEKSLSRAIVKTDINFPEYPIISTEGIIFLKEALNKNPAFRITAPEMEHSPWLAHIQNGTAKKPGVENIMNLLKGAGSDLRVAKGKPSDWIMPDLYKQNKNEDKVELVTPVTPKQHLKVPVTDIKFRRESRINNQKDKSASSVASSSKQKGSVDKPWLQRRTAESRTSTMRRLSEPRQSFSKKNPFLPQPPHS